MKRILLLQKTPAVRRGMALLLVMWAMFFMSFSILGLVQLLNLNVTDASAMERVALLSAAAQGGASVGRLPGFPVGGAAQKFAMPPGISVEVRATSEGGRLQINALLARQDRDTLHRLFHAWGLSAAESDTVIDCLLDFVEPGEARRLNGAKRPQYEAIGRPDLPPGRPFLAVEEMKQVLNFDLVTRRQPDWPKFFTIYGDGKLDLASASPDLLRAVLQLGDSSIRAIQQQQEQASASASATSASSANSVTPASPWADLDAARLTMGLTEKEFDSVQHYLTVASPFRRVEVTARMGTLTRSLEAVFDLRQEAQQPILKWSAL